MTAEEIIKNDKNDKDSRTNSLTIKTVFFSYSSLPSTFFLPIVITAKGIYPPSLYLLSALFLPSPSPVPLIKRSLSVPTKLITMTEHQEKTQPPLLPPSSSKIAKSFSAPIIPTTTIIDIVPDDIVIPMDIVDTPTIASSPVPSTSDTTQMTTKITQDTERLVGGIPMKTLKPTSIDTLTPKLSDAILQRPRPSSSTDRSLNRNSIPSPVQVKGFHSTPIKLSQKKKKFTPIVPSQRTEKRLRIQERSNDRVEEDEEDEPMIKPLSLAEKRKRQAKRADQVKVWKVREEREAREARLQLRRQMMNAPAKKKNMEAQPPPTIRKKKKRVKFNFDRNRIIQLPLSDQE
ncbi:hypothetical protein BD560DRAFT_410754 [Blakeslea trispora]|nr:hypothetical protein BD560DRAFT_410754 [Blakeslea trispora]